MTLRTISILNSFLHLFSTFRQRLRATEIVTLNLWRVGRVKRQGRSAIRDHWILLSLMAEPERTDYKRIENHLKSSMDKPQWESNMRAIQNIETKMDETHAELRKADTTKEKLAGLLPNRKDLLLRWKTLVAANTALLKGQYQPEWSDSKGDRFCRYRNELDSLETRHKNFGQMLTMMRSLKNEGQLKEFLQLQISKEKCDDFRKRR